MATVAELDAMVAAGVTAEAILAAVREDLVALEARRRADATRQKKRRHVTASRDSHVISRDAVPTQAEPPVEAKQTSPTSNGDHVTEAPRARADSITTLSSTTAVLDSENNNSLFGDMPSHKKSRKSRSGTRLPDDWEPSEADIAFAQSDGLTGNDLRLEIMRFRNHWTTKSGRDAMKVRWDRTWENWVINRHQFKRGGHGQGPGQQGGRKSGGAAGLAAIAMSD